LVIARASWTASLKGRGAAPAEVAVLALPESSEEVIKFL
jgi:hypothetical protein